MATGTPAEIDGVNYCMIGDTMKVIGLAHAIPVSEDIADIREETNPLWMVPCRHRRDRITPRPIVASIRESIGPDARVTHIGKDAFREQNIGRLKVGQTVKIIETGACHCCHSLERVEFSRNCRLSEIQKRAFAYCSLLAAITIPQTVTTIGAFCFTSCSALSSICFEEGSELADIRRGAFSRTAVETLVLPASVTRIRRGCFAGCRALSRVMFEGKSALARLGGQAFAQTAISAFVVPTRVNAIRTGTFSHASLATIDFGPGSPVTLIYRQAFMKSALQSITIPEGVQIIGESAFSRCTSLRNVDFSHAWNLIRLEQDAFLACVLLEQVDIPNAVTFIGVRCFARCAKLRTVIVGNQVVTIKRSAFENCKVLSTVTFSGRSARISIRRRAFAGCSSLFADQTVEFPPSLIFLGDSAFAGTCIQGAIFPDTLATIGASAFCECRSLTRVHFNETSRLESIGDRAFAFCISLPGISLPPDTKSVGEGCFYGCTSLEHCVLPPGLTEIANELFRGCTNLSELVLPGGITRIAPSAFIDCPYVVSTLDPPPPPSQS
jgi:hypothetical protein